MGERVIATVTCYFDHIACQNILGIGFTDRDIEFPTQACDQRFEDAALALVAIIEWEIEF
jgi:hypothetical protein